MQTYAFFSTYRAGRPVYFEGYLKKKSFLCNQKPIYFV